MTPEDFKKHGHQLIDWIADYIENVEQQRVTSQVGPGEIRSQLAEHPPATPDGFDAVMAATGTMGATHDRMFRFTFGQPEHAAPLLRTLLPMSGCCSCTGIAPS